MAFTYFFISFQNLTWVFKDTNPDILNIFVAWSIENGGNANVFLWFIWLMKYIQHDKGLVIVVSFSWCLDSSVACIICIMMTSSNGNIFRVTGHLCGKFTGPWWIPHTKPVTRSFVVFFDLRLNKRFSKQSWGWWFKTLSHPLWRHCNDFKMK